MDPVVEVRPGMAMAAVRRRWPWIVVATLIGLIGGYAAGQVLTTTYSSTAVVFLNPLAGNPYTPETSTARSDQLVALETEAALVSTSDVGERADALAEGGLPDDPEDKVSVSVPSNSQVLRVSYQAGSGAGARLGAQSFADAYLAYRQEQAEAAATEQASQLEAQISSSQRLLDEASGRLSAAGPDSAEAVLLGQQVQTYASQLAQLQGEMAAVTNAAKNPGDVISAATIPSSADGYPPSLLLAGGILGGLAAGVLLALWRERSDDRLHESHDITTLGAGPVLALLPSSRPLGRPAKGATGSTASHAEDSAEGFRLLRTAVLGKVPRRATIAVAGASPDIDATGVAVGLAQATARSGRRVVLAFVDPSGLRRPLGPGLTNLLAGDADEHGGLDDMLIEVAPKLHVLGGGNAQPARDLISRESMSTVLGALRPRADLIILAAPPVSEAAGQEVVATADATLLVAQFGSTTHEELLAVREQLSELHANVLGVAAIARRRRLMKHREPEVWRTLGLAWTSSIGRPAGPGEVAPALEPAPPERNGSGRPRVTKSQPNASSTTTAEPR